MSKENLRSFTFFDRFRCNMHFDRIQRYGKYCVFLVRVKQPRHLVASGKMTAICERACNYENMLAHGISCQVRVEKQGK